MELTSSLAKNATNKAFEIIPLQTTRKENNWKTEEDKHQECANMEKEKRLEL